ncbi:MAG: DUF5719 family protein [Acidimicrobiales bacterium]|nr:DUF5719 family protein [Acidimicrobiales bacterium]
MALIVAGVVLERNDEWRSSRAGSSADVFSLAKLMPTAARPGAAGSVWFCAAGTATGRADGMAEQTVVIFNVSGETVEAKITVFPDQGDPVTRAFEVAALSRRDVVISELVTAEHAAALVELSGGEAAVEHVLRGPNGAAAAACSSTSSNRWYVPAGSTTPGSREILAIFNPFPKDASVDIAFETADGRRRPDRYTNLLVRGSAVTPVDITDVVTVRDQVAALVTVGSGRVVVDHLQIFDGSGGEFRGLSVSPAATTASPQWFFADGQPAANGLAQSIVVLNPSDQNAEVEVQVREATSGRAVEPYDAGVRSGQYKEMSVLADERLPRGESASFVVLSTNQTPVVAAQVLKAKGSGEGAALAGVEYTMGSPLLARRWLVPAGAFPEATGADVLIANPTDQEIVVTVNAIRRGRSGRFQGFEERSIAPGARVSVDVSALRDEQVGIEVVADGPVLVQHRLQFAAPIEVATAIAVPVDGTQVDTPIAPLIEIDLGGVPGGTELPPGIELPVPGTGPGTSLTPAPGTIVGERTGLPDGTVPGPSTPRSEVSPTQPGPDPGAPTSVVPG